MRTPNISGLILTILDFSSVIQFLIGGLLFWKITQAFQHKRASKFALLGVISSFVGGLPNACDKFHWAFGADTVFNSNWMFVFVGMGFSLLFYSILLLGREKRQGKETVMLSTALPIIMLVTLALLPKPVKYVFMLLATVGMIAFYSHMYRLARHYIGKLAVWYIVSIFMTLVLSGISAICKDFTQYWPNILAQTSNNIAYIGFIFANKKWLKSLKSANEVPLSCAF